MAIKFEIWNYTFEMSRKITINENKTINIFWNISFRFSLYLDISSIPKVHLESVWFGRSDRIASCFFYLLLEYISKFNILVNYTIICFLLFTATSIIGLVVHTLYFCNAVQKTHMSFSRSLKHRNQNCVNFKWPFWNKEIKDLTLVLSDAIHCVQHKSDIIKKDRPDNTIFVRKGTDQPIQYS